MPTDTQRAPGLRECVEAEREAHVGLIRTEHSADAINRARAATDEAVKAAEGLARAVLDMQAWSIVGSNFDPALRVTDLETLNQLRHLASKIIPSAAPTTSTGVASDEVRRKCYRKQTGMTPCVVEDGEGARDDDGYCVGCGLHVAIKGGASDE